MKTITVRNLLRRLFRPARNTQVARRLIRPALEALEARDAPAVFTVTSALDDNSAGTLRSVLGMVNYMGGASNTVNFAIGGGGSAQTINLDPTKGALPGIQHPVTINGWSQGGGPGYAPLIQINGNDTSQYAPMSGLVDNAGGTTIRGLAIYRFALDGIVLNNPSWNSTGDVVEGCYVGTDANGDAGLGNGTGVLVEGANDTVGDSTGVAINIVSGNTNAGITVSGSGATGTQVLYDWIGVGANGIAALGNGIVAGVNVGVGAVRGTIKGNVVAWTTGGNGVALFASNWQVVANYIGVAADGVTPAANAMNGVYLSDLATNCQIGINIPGLGNVIAANGGSGVVLDGSTSNQVTNNYIGLDAHGNAQGNTNYGVVLKQNATSGQGASGNTIGGANVISGNGLSGVLISDGNTTQNVVEGNLIGTNKDGTAIATIVNGQPTLTANGLDGVRIMNGANANTIGGTAASARNVITGNKKNGVHLTDSGTTKNVVAGDYIGTDVAGAIALGNGLDGVLIETGASANSVGQLAPAQVTVISGNSNAGVGILAGCSQNHVINCYIGTDAGGTKKVGNNGDGIDLEGDTNWIGDPTQPGAATDVISGNNNGILISGAGAKNNNIIHAFIGTDYSGNAQLIDPATGLPTVGNSKSGVAFAGDAGGNSIGDAAAADGCVVSNNGGFGVDLGTSTGETVENDNIGLGADGMTQLPNTSGWINGDLTKNTVNMNKHQ